MTPLVSQQFTQIRKPSLQTVSASHKLTINQQSTINSSLFFQHFKNQKYLVFEKRQLSWTFIWCTPLYNRWRVAVLRKFGNAIQSSGILLDVCDVCLMANCAENVRIGLWPLFWVNCAFRWENLHSKQSVPGIHMHSSLPDQTSTTQEFIPWKNRNGIWSNHFFHPVVSIKKATLHTLQAGEKTWTGWVQ